MSTLAASWCKWAEARRSITLQLVDVSALTSGGESGPMWEELIVQFSGWNVAV